MLDSGSTTVGNAHDLSRLYRAAEARAARLRLLVEAGRVLAGAQGAELDTAVNSVARQAAHLLGYAEGRIETRQEAHQARVGPNSLALPLLPAGATRPVGILRVHGRSAPGSEVDPDDEEAVGVLRQLVAGALAARAREARLTGLLAQLFGAQERERAHVARELHDGVAQTATAAMRHMELAAESGDTVDAVRASELARQTVGELRAVIAGMRPTALDDLGLAPALEQLTRALADDGFDARLSIGAVGRLPAALEVALFRVVQEALNNVRSHAGSRCRVDVVLTALPGDLVLDIRDTGCGFDIDAPRNDGRAHLGLAFMAERVGLLGGTLAVESAPGSGTRVCAKVPLA